MGLRLGKSGSRCIVGESDHGCSGRVDVNTRLDLAPREPLKNAHDQSARSSRERTPRRIEVSSSSRLLRRDCICMNLILCIGATKLREQRLTLAESCSLLKRISVSRDHRDTSSLGSYSSPPRSTWSTATRSLVIINSSSITVMVVDDDATVGWLARFDRSDVLFVLLVFSCLFR